MGYLWKTTCMVNISWVGLSSWDECHSVSESCDFQHMHLDYLVSVP